MLVLSRKKNEQIIIDDKIVITVVEIRSGAVRLGIEAPKEVSVSRPDARDKKPKVKEETKPPASMTEVLDALDRELV